MTRTISPQSFTDDDQTIGRLSWMFSEHLSRHIASQLGSDIETLGETIHDQLMYLAPQCLTSLEHAAREVWTPTIPIGNARVVIQLNGDDEFGTLSWMPGESLQFVLNALFAADVDRFNTAVIVLRRTIAYSAYQILLPVCLGAPTCPQCVEACSNILFGAS